MKDKSYKCQTLVILSAIIWGSSFPIMKVTLVYVEPLTLTLIRMLLGALLALPILLAVGGLKKDLFRDKYIWAVSLINAFAFSFQHVGMSYTDASKAALLINLNVVFVALLATFFLREKLTSNKLIAIVLALLGVFLLTTRGNLSAVAGGQLKGDIIVLLVGFIWAFGIILTKKGLDMGRNPLEFSLAIVIETSILLLPLSIFYSSHGLHSLINWAYVFYLGAICTTLAFAIWVIGLKGISATVSSIILLLEVVFAVSLSIIFLGEEASPPLLLGGFLILLAIVFVSFETKPNITQRSRS